jgi:1-acyl-sn-glycerol-3-phosphate acyltransferase
MRTIWTFFYSILFLIGSIPTLQKVKKESKKQLPADQLDEILFQVPKKWARKTVDQSGSTVEVIGNDTFPEGPVLLVANHQGNFDIPVALGFLNKPFGFISKIEMKKIPIARTWMSYMHCVFMDRKDKRQSVRAFKQGIDYLKNGHSLIIFPEGTRSQGEQTKPFKSGSFRLATKAGVPIVPIAIDGTYKVMEANKGKIKPAHVKLTVCEPIMPEEFETYKLDQLAEMAQSRIVEALQK